MGVRAPEEPERSPGALIGLLSLVVGLLWIVGVAAGSVALLGPDLLRSLTPVQMGALAAGALLPAFMVWFSGVAAREGARARAEARRLADAADRLLNPAAAAGQSASELANSVRSEINTLDRALEQTLSRIREVEGMIGRQAQVVDSMADQAKAGAGQMITGMEREREELMRISQDLTAQAQAIGDSISKHTRAISEAARAAEQEVRAADSALDNRLSSFGAAAALITDRTQALTGAAQASADSALRLEHALSNALDILAKATHLTDAARDSADAASVAANSTASAVRDSTTRAIEDAKRAADLIRGEAVTVEREAAIALERLRDAADAARTAAIEARAAVEETPLPDRPRVAPQRSYQPPAEDWQEPESPHAAPRGPPRRVTQAEESMFGERADNSDGSPDWTWRELLSGVDNNTQQRRRGRERSQPAGDPVARLKQTITEPPRQTGPSMAITEIIEQGGFRVSEVFSGSALDRIAQRARAGSQARRRAVKDAAPEAVRKLAEHLAQNPHANQEAMLFLRSEGARIAELLSRGRAAMGAEATRVFLLIDSAAG